MKYISVECIGDWNKNLILSINGETEAQIKIVVHEN